MFISWSDKRDLKHDVEKLKHEVRVLQETINRLVMYREELPTDHPIFKNYNEISFKDLFKLILDNMGLRIVKHPSEYVLEVSNEA